jgi:hypothetical protein
MGILNSASEVWKFLKSNAGLNVELYDGDLIDEIRAKLRLPNGKFDKLLKNNSITTKGAVYAT